MSAGTLGHYFRSFLVKLSMLEAQLGNLAPGGKGLALIEYQWSNEILFRRSFVCHRSRAQRQQGSFSASANGEAQHARLRSKLLLIIEFS